MVVIDETPECNRAVHFAARRASRTGASLLMLAVVTPPDNFEWIGVGEAMIEEAQEEAAQRLEGAAGEARSAAGVEPEKVILVGEKAASITKLIEDDEDISFLVLAAGTEQGRSRSARLDDRRQGRLDFPGPDRDRARKPHRRGDRRARGVKSVPGRRAQNPIPTHPESAERREPKRRW